MNLVKSVCLVVLISLSVVACSKSDYEANMKARENIELFESKYQAKMVDSIMKNIQWILTPFENEARKQAKADIIEIKTSSTQVKSSYRTVVRDPKDVAEYAISEMAAIMHRQIDNDTREMIMLIKRSTEENIVRARNEAIKYLTDTIVAIMNEHDEEFGTPMTQAQVWNNLVNKTPFIATVAGMYGLGVEGIQNAGTEIAQITDSAVNTGSGTAATTLGNARTTIGSGNSKSGNAQASSSGETMTGNKVEEQARLNQESPNASTSGSSAKDDGTIQTN